VRTKVVQVGYAIEYLRDEVGGNRLCEVALRGDPARQQTVYSQGAQ